MEAYCSTQVIQNQLGQIKNYYIPEWWQSSKEWSMEIGVWGNRSGQRVKIYWYDPKLFLTKYFKGRSHVVKYGMNSIWSWFLIKKEIPTSAKIQVFDAVTRATLCIGAQVWGWKDYDTVEPFDSSWNDC